MSVSAGVNLVVSSIINILYSFYIAYNLNTYRIAVHFGSGGFPDGYQTPLAFIVFQSVLSFFIALFFFFIIWLIRKVPVRFVNIPNRQKWLCGEERDKSLKKIDFMVLLLGTVTIYFLMAMNAVVYLANVSVPLQLPVIPFFSILVIFCLCVVVWCIKLFEMFK